MKPERVLEVIANGARQISEFRVVGMKEGIEI